MTARWSAGFLIGLPFACAGVLLVALISAYAWLRSPHDGRDTIDDGWKAIYRVGFGVLALLLLGLPWAFFPWSAQYHRWVPKSGTVVSVGGRFLAGSNGGTFQKFVVQMSDGNRYGCNDTRCSLVKPGDHLVLSCKRAWQWTGVPGWDCNYVTDSRLAS